MLSKLKKMAKHIVSVLVFINNFDAVNVVGMHEHPYFLLTSCSKASFASSSLYPNLAS